MNIPPLVWISCEWDIKLLQESSFRLKAFACFGFSNFNSYTNKGMPGAHGPMGADGEPGRDGELGLDGLTGMKGSRGENGRALLNGEFGEQGKNF